VDIEFHYYITFILARKGGFSAHDAQIIACSSQYTDDNNFRYFVNFKDGSYYLNEVSQTFDITKPSPKRQKIYPLFHFIPGGEGCADRNQFSRIPYHDFITIPDSPNARVLFGSALASNDLYRIGIATHVYADTWAHQNFVGFKHKLNGKRGFGNLIPNIGHADFMYEPDKVHNKWSDTRLKKKYAEIDNDQRFLEAAKMIFIHFWKFKHPEDNKKRVLEKYNELHLDELLQDAMDETYLLGSHEKVRIMAYRKICRELDKKKYRYDPKKWRHDAVEKREFETDLFDRYWAKENFYESDWYRFQEGIKAHRSSALKRLKPLYAKVGLPV